MVNFCAVRPPNSRGVHARILILVDSDEIDAGLDRSTPSDDCRVERTEIVGMEPAMAAFVRLRLSVQRIKPNPESALVSVSNEIVEAVILLRGPGACRCLAGRLDDSPGIIPPAMVVVRRIRSEHCWRGSWVVAVRPCSAENEKLSAD